MMKMDDQDSAECQIWEKKDMTIILEFVLNELNEKILNSNHILH